MPPVSTAACTAWMPRRATASGFTKRAGQVWASPLVADGKVYLGSGKKILWVLAAGKELKVINRIRMHDAVYTTPTAANGVLYVLTNRHLYAVGK